MAALRAAPAALRRLLAQGATRHPSAAQLRFKAVPSFAPASGAGDVNGIASSGGLGDFGYEPLWQKPSSQPSSTKSSVSPSHWEESWSAEEITSRSAEHVMATWGPGSALRDLPTISHGDGCYLVDIHGKRYLDWTSQAICTNLGYDVPPSVLEAVQRQMARLPMVYGGIGNTEIRVRLASLLSELLPGDGHGLLFPCSGAEANEAAIRIARRYTGRPKIINHYRSYHGGSANALAATGDFRRGFSESGGSSSTGFVKTMNPTDSHLFSFGATDEERTARALGYLEEQILCEGPQTVAAIMLESVVGSGGVFLAPPGYMEGVRAICDRHGIVMIADEVMVGFGRTGKFWGFQHYDFVPDIVTSAKGLTGAYMPLSMVACSRRIKEHFESAPLGWGSTFHAHPVSLAAGYECVKYMLERDVVGHVRDAVEPVMREQIGRLVAKYDSVARGRCIGGFGCVDLMDPSTGAPVQNFDGSGCSNPAAVAKFRAALRENGLLGFVRPPMFHCAPALVITPSELEDGFSRADKALEVYDRALRG